MFERYTDEAKPAIFFARTEAVVRNESTISAKDLLPGLAREEKSRAHQISSRKARDADLRSALGIAPFPPQIDRSLLEPNTALPLDGDAKKTLRYTAQEADLDHEFWIDADHQLRGLLRFPNAAADALAKLDVGLEAMRAASIRNREEFPSRQVPKEHSRRLLREFLPCS
jgi:hypothetical protein